DPLGKATTFGWDNADRPTSMTLPGGSAYGYAHHANGNRTSVTMPSGAVHALTYDALNRVAHYTPPTASAYAQSFDADRLLTQVALPGGRSVDLGYDTGGRPTSQNDHTGPTLTGQTTFAYANGDPTSRVSVATRTITGAFTTHTSLAYDGTLVVGKTVDT